MTFIRRIDLSHLLFALFSVAGVTAVYVVWLGVTNHTTVALSYLLVVLFVAASSSLWVAIATSTVAMLAFNFFFFPPVGTFTIADPQNWIALFVFLAVSLVASRLSALARDRQEIAIERIHFLEERRQAELAQRSAEFKSALLASLAHDLRTPLTTIRVAATNLHASWLTDVQREEQAGLVVAEVERLTRLFQNILEMTRIEAGAVVHACQWVDPSEIVEAARSQIEPTSSAHQIQVVRRSEDRVVHVDPRLTSAALAHLLENAAQYSPAGSCITVAHEVTGEGLLVTVEDEGRGIAPSDRPRLFEPFYRGEQGPRHTSGTGMGLAIARGLLAAEHGRVWAENCPAGGARLSILIPTPSRPAPVALDEP